MGKVLNIGECDICETIGNVREVCKNAEGKPVLMCKKCEEEDNKAIAKSVKERLAKDNGETLSHAQVMEEIEKMKNKNIVSLK